MLRCLFLIFFLVPYPPRLPHSGGVGLSCMSAFLPDAFVIFFSFDPFSGEMERKQGVPACPG